MHKEKEFLMNQTYRRFIDAGLGLNNSVSLKDIVDEKLMGFGTTMDEKIFNLSELEELLARQKEQSKDINLQWEVKPLSHYTSADENTAFFADELFLHATVGGEPIEMYLRFSVVLSYVSNQWKVIHWHGSKPENVQSEEDTFGIENWKQKAEALEKLVEERTADLKEKNRELEIEASLERVRTVAMAMNKADDMLNVCRTISDQLQQLGFREIRNVQTAIIYQQTHEYLNYQYFTFYDKDSIERIDYRLHPEVLKFSEIMLQSPDAYYTKTFEGDELNTWRQYRKETAQLSDPKLDEVSSSHYYFYSIGSGALGVTTYAALSEEQIILFKRFRNVFQLAYSRFTDIEKAGAQAREAQIEAALERVRARTMAMQQSTEFPEAANVLFQQMQALGMPAWSAGYCIWDDDKKGITLWMSSEGVMQPSFHAPLTEDPSFIHMKEAHERGESFHIEAVGGEELVQHYKYMRTLPGIGEILDSIIEAGHPLPVFQIFHCVYFSQGFLLFITYQPVTEAHDIFKRFGKVFDQTYTRFLDLQKAEEQAREARIEAALEKVRSRSLAMQKSEELKDVIQVVHDQMVHLNIRVEHAGFIMDYKKRDDMHIWLADKQNVPSQVTIPYFDSPHWNSFMEAKATGKNFFVNQHSFEEKNKFYGELFKLFSVPDDAKDYYFSCPGLSISTVLLDNVGLYIENFSGIPYSDEDNAILMRFGKVFQQTYTRFNDLQKAEAQAKEAKIEAALEKVRSRSLAVHKSDEFNEVIKVVFERLQELDIAMTSASINVFIEGSKDMEVYVCGAGEDGLAISHFFLAHFDHPISNDRYEAYVKGMVFFTKTYEAEEKNSFYKYQFDVSDLKYIPDDIKKLVMESQCYTISMAINKNSMIVVNDFEGKLLSKEEQDIVKRFAKVFEQAYIRFLDLQKAEEQAREAKIEYSLEKVRAQAMAMHKSEELLNVCRVMYLELESLGFKDLRNAMIHTFDDSQDFFLDYDFSGVDPGKITQIPTKGFSTVERYLKEIKKSTDAFVEILMTGEELQKWKQVRKTTGQIDDPRLESADRIYYYYYSIGMGDIGISTFSPISKLQMAVLERFRNVFQLSYQRYVDITTAEAQARGNQIQLALERVRARTMAMQHSNELLETALMLYEQFKNLGAAPLHFSIGIFNEKEEVIEFWLTSQGNKLDDVVKAPISEPRVISKLYQAWKNHQKSMAIDLDGEELQEYLNFRAKHTGIVNQERVQNRRIVNAGFFSSGLINFSTMEPISSETEELLVRFAGVFDLTYTRFSDLKLAEAQARENQIQLALERVRARTMAMQHSEELSETASVLFEQFNLLGTNPERIAIEIVNEKENVFEIWATQHGGSQLNLLLKASLDEPHVMQKMYRAWKEQKKSITIDLQGRELEEYFQYLTNAGLPVQREIFGKRRVQNVATFSKGILTIITPEPRPRETIDILERFAGVFDGTYTRFLDLQKAEAQAKESQIQLALERVRARTMAMQHSDELQDAAALLFQQVKALGVETGSCGFNIWNEKEKGATVWMSSPEGGLQTPFKLPHTDSAIYKQVSEAMKKGEDFLVKEVKGKELVKHFDYLLTLPGIGNVIKKLRDTGYKFPETLVYNFAFFNNGYLSFHLHEQHSQEEDIFKRFAKVFEQTYTRFLDLQKAEAQAREAQIETALEKVRSRSLAMHNSEEIKEVVKTIVEKITELNIEMNGGASLVTFSPGSKDLLHWIWIPGQFDEPLKAYLPYFDNIMFRDCNEGREKGLDLVAKVYSGEEKKNYFTHIFNHSGFIAVPDDSKAWVMAQEYFGFSFAIQNHSGIFLNDYTGKLFSKETNDILIRFSKVFEQSYVRFLDLQKAEAQAKEAQIEAALERVRSRSLAMHNSDELKEVVTVLFEKLQELGFVLNNGGAVILIFSNDSKDVVHWVASPDLLSSSIHLAFPYFVHPINIDLFAEKEKGTDFYAKIYSHEEKNKFYRHAYQFSDYKFLPDELKNWLLETESYTLSFALEEKSAIVIFDFYKRLLSVPESRILKRFSKVFEQAYVRFLDLQKAEAQAREAQIETALEKVRSHTMGMRSSNDLANVASVMLEQVKMLGGDLFSCGIVLCDENKNEVDQWLSMPGAGMLPPFYVPVNLDYIHQYRYSQWKAGVEIFSIEIPSDYIEKHFELIYALPSMKAILTMFGEQGLQPPPTPPWEIDYGASFRYGYLLISAFRPFEEKKIFARFAKVFEQTYIRFLDLQKAEAQAREAQIEASLERVRARAMSMHKSEDLHNAVAVVFEELNKLELGVLRVGISVLNKKKRCGDVWLTSVDEGNAVQVYGSEPFDIHPLLQGSMNAWINQQDFYYVLEGEDLTRYYQAVEAAKFGLPPSQMLLSGDGTKRQSCFVAVYNSGGLFAFREGEFPDEAKKVMRRFASVFDLTYQRFLDLQKAEAQAREAQIEAALERVRSRTLAMQKSDELAETAAVLFKQLILLGIEPNRLYINIIKNENGDAEFWITDEDGSKVSSAVNTNMMDNSCFKKMFEGWKEKKKSLILDMTGQELQKYLEHLSNLHVVFKSGAVQQRRLQYLAYFNKGFIGMASPDEQPEGTMLLLERFAAVFNLTFTRFNDLKIAEAHAEQAELDLIELKEEKQRTEQALAELQVTQKQLIQSEKMASLGELTAGIAHEIQNPLNFVNNFSEVSTELVAEMNEEITRGNLEDAAAIAADLKSNLEKINHHGKRAGDIVKGMLQHSRSGAATKEPTDINKLTDEYVRLAYHGLRAKDKTFNATLHTEYDETIGNINIIPQDIGRVLLNLLTNALYAVNEKGKTAGSDFNPAVSIATKKLSHAIEIRVKDNGNGIPKNIVDKIFQPFFTTKPTGQGTGLGLSLAYDIIKAHSGELKVETKEGEGSEFVMQLLL